MTVVGVLALQGDVREHLRALESAGAKARAVRRPDELAGLDGLVIPGGESTTMSKLASEFGLFEPLREFVAAGGATYGSCAGMIMLSSEILDGRPDQRAFGGIDMTVRRNAFGRQVDSFEAQVPIEGVDGGPFHAVFIRAPWVERVGRDVEVLGRVSEGSVPSHAQVRGGTSSVPSHAQVRGGTSSATGRIVAVRQGNLLATSFHPELTGDLRVHRLFVTMAGGRS